MESLITMIIVFEHLLRKLITLAIKVNPKTIWDIAISMAAEVKWFFLLTLLMIKAEIEYPITQALCTKIDNI